MPGHIQRGLGSAAEQVNGNKSCGARIHGIALSNSLRCTCERVVPDQRLHILGAPPGCWDLLSDGVDRWAHFASFASANNQAAASNCFDSNEESGFLSLR